MTPQALFPLGFDVPVDPDADQARRWLVDELAKPEYQQRASLLDTILRWIGEQLDKLEGALSVAPGGMWLYVVIALLIVALVVVLAVLGPVRLRRAPASSAPVLIDETRSAAQIRAAARAAADAGQWQLATIEQFRAIVRSLEERTILDEKPGRTAHEVAPDSARALPTLRADLAAGGDRFDAISYGGRVAKQADFEAMRQLDQRVGEARPARNSTAEPAGVGS